LSEKQSVNTKLLISHLFTFGYGSAGLRTSFPKARESKKVMEVEPLPKDAHGARKLLRRWREDNVRRSEDVIHLWETVLAPEAVATAEAVLAEELWMVLEQVRHIWDCQLS